MKRRFKKILLSTELLILIIILFFLNARSMECKAEILDAQKYFKTSSMAVDSIGYPHFAYNRDHLYYTYYDRINWQYMTVNLSPLDSNYASITLDTEENAHVSYFDVTNRSLKYAMNNSGIWQIHNYNWKYLPFYNSLQTGVIQNYSLLWSTQDYFKSEKIDNFYLLSPYICPIYNNLYNYFYIDCWNRKIIYNRSIIKPNLFNSYDIPSGFLNILSSAQYNYFASIYSELDMLKFMPFNTTDDDYYKNPNIIELIEYPTEPIIYDLEGDYYYFDDNKQRRDLNRIKNEIAIKGDQEKIEKIIKLLLPEKSFDKQSIGKNNHKYEFDDVLESDFTTWMINILKNYSVIEFISPVFILEGFRCSLTENICLKLKEGYSENDLIAINPAYIQIEEMFLPRIYVLIVKNAKERDMLEIARWYAEFAFIEWAEPDLLCEIKFHSP